MSVWDKNKEKRLTHQRLTAVLRYVDGQLIWRVRQPPRGYEGNAAGSKVKKGYVWISIDGTKYPRCRLVWFYFKKSWPSDEIDHKDRIKDNDKIKNLREATRLTNSRNAIRKRKLPPGVYLHGNRYRSYIQVNKKQHRLGSFRTINEAEMAYKKASLRLHGKFSPFWRHKDI